MRCLEVVLCRHTTGDVIGETFISCHHKGAEDPKSVLVGESGERSDDMLLIHDSSLHELLN